MRYNMSLDKLYYSIGEASRLSGVPETTLRYWDSRGILSPSRRDGKRRYYTARDIEKARRIKELTDGGLTLEGAAKKLAGKSRVPPEAVQEIREIIALVTKLREGKPGGKKTGKERESERREGIFG